MFPTNYFKRLLLCGAVLAAISAEIAAKAAPYKGIILISARSGCLNLGN